jgi:hypothetical protein
MAIILNLFHHVRQDDMRITGFMLNDVANCVNYLDSNKPCRWFSYELQSLKEFV